MSERLTIGCDPEFGFISKSNGRKVNPPGGLSTADTMGIDGCGRICELRPPPAESPAQLVKSIGTILQEGLNERFAGHSKYRWKAGGMVDDEALGGHIHFGHRELVNHQDNHRNIQMLLNTLVAPIALLVEDPDEAVGRRLGTSYGRLDAGSIRSQPHGVEWRVLPSFLTSPDDAIGLTSLAYCVAAEFKNKEFIAAVEELPIFDQDTYNACDKQSVIYYVPPMLNVIKTAGNWKKMRDEIMIIINKVVRQELMDTADMQKTWGLKAPVAAGATD